MALEDEVSARYGAQRLINLTNPQAAKQKTLDSTRLAKACRDVEGDLFLFAGITFDVTKNWHVSLAVPAVEMKLLNHTGQVSAEKADSDQAAWERKLRSLSKLRKVSKVVPTSTSRYTPSNPNPNAEQLRPPFDRERFDRLVPRQPEF
jgi:hypothetical protein